MNEQDEMTKAALEYAASLILKEMAGLDPGSAWHGKLKLHHTAIAQLQVRQWYEQNERTR